MKTKIFTLIAALMFLSYSISIAQTAKVQIIHNSADASADTVDVYLDGSKILNDFAFRNATSFLDVPADVNVDIGIAPQNSSSVDDTIYNAGVTFASSEKYIVVANGIVSAGGYNPSPDFGFNVYGLARESASNSGNTDVLVFHGSTDAPAVDVMEPNAQLQLVDDLSYGGFTSSYLELTTADYSLQIQDETGYTAVAQFGAPLSTLGLEDSALVVVASGFLDPSQNSDGPAFGLFAALPEGGELVALPAKEISGARVQVIHNSADLAADTVDIYLNDGILLDDFAFRNASPFVDVTAGVNFDISVQPKSSTDTVDALAKFTYNLPAGSKYVLIANGIVSGSGYSPTQAFDIFVKDMAREKATTAGNTDVLVFHGSTDAPAVDVMEPNAQLQLVDDLSYGGFTSSYLELTTADYSLQIQDETGYTAVAQFGAPLSTLGLEDSALVVVASGFLDPSQNSDGPAFGLFAALPEGGELVELPSESVAKAMVQVIHNSADAAASSVDIYKNDVLLLNDFAFRSASSFVEMTAGVNFDISVQPSGSSDTTGSLAKFTYNLLPDENYILVATGVVSSSGYEPVKPFDIAVFEGARMMASQSGNTDVLVYHGATDAPVVDIYESSVPAGTWVDNLSYKSFSDDYLELVTNNYVLEVQDSTGSTVVGSFYASLDSLGLTDSAIVVLASGFLNPADNSSGAGFGLFAALSSGGALVQLPVYQEDDDVTDIDEVFMKEDQVSIYPNPVQSQLNIQIDNQNGEEIRVELYDILGKKIANLTEIPASQKSIFLSYDANGLEEGIYFISVTNGNSRYTQKIQVVD